MNREILFRGKRPDNGKWVQGDLIRYGKHTSIRYDKNESVKNQPVYTECIVIPETVGQFTGLTDKNGLKIFEGDIRDFNGGVGCVIWDDVCFAIKSPLSEAVDHEHSSVFISSTLLGNIYDNKF